MPKYIVNGKTYNIPGEKVAGFEGRYPDATVEYHNEGKTYLIPLNKRNGFLKRFPNASYTTVEPEKPIPAGKESYTFTEEQLVEGPQTIQMANREEIKELAPHVDSLLLKRGEYLDAENKRKEDNMPWFARIMNNAPRGGGMAGIPDYAKTNNGRLADNEYMSLQAAANSLRNAQRIIDEADHNAASGGLDAWLERSFAGGVARGLGQKLFDVRTWDMGVNNALEEKAIASALDAYEKGGRLSEGQQALLDAKAIELATNAYFGSYVGRGYKAGQVTAEAIPFMLEMTVNPASSIGKGVASSLSRYALKRFGKTAAKGIGRAVGDLATAHIMTATTGSIRTMADAQRRMNGDLQFTTNDDGYSVFAGAENGEDAVTAIAKAFGATTIENYSEMVGEYFAPLLKPVGKGIAKGLDKLHLGKVSQFIDDVRMSDVGRLVADFEENAKWSGVFGEYAEEVVGGIINALTVGDQTLDTDKDTGVFNLDNNIDTFLGVSLLGGFMSAAKTVGYRTPKYRAKKEVSKADVVANEMLPNWGELKEELSANNFDAIKKLLLSNDYTPEQRRAVLEYVAAQQTYSGIMQGEAKKKEEGNTDKDMDDFISSYDNGYTLTTPKEMNDAKNMYDYKRQMLERIVGEDIELFDSDALNTYKAMSSGHPWGENAMQAAREYVNAKATYDGVLQRVRDDIDERIEQSDAIVNARTNRTTGMIQPATMKVNDRRVYVIGGNIVQYADGSGIDVEASDNSIIVRDAETGELEQVSPDAVMNIDEALDPTTEMQTAADAIRQQYAQEAANRIDGVITAFNEGDTYTITGDDAQIQVQIVANDKGIVDNGDGTVNVSDGTNVFPLSKETIQQQVDEANLARVALFEQQKMAENAAYQQAIEEESRPQYALNDLVSLRDENGNAVRGNITTDADADGRYEVYTEAPINGKRVNLFTRDELDSMLMEHNGVVFEQPTDNEGNNGDENIPENGNIAPQNIPAMQRIPKDEQGNPIYEQTDSDTAWDAIVEQTEGDEGMAQTVANAMVADKEAALKNAQKAKSKGGATIAEKIAAEKERKAAIDAAQQELDIWKEIAGTANRRRMEAEAVKNMEIGNETLDPEDILDKDVIDITTPEEFIALHIPKITPESFKRETGLSNTEQRNLVGFIAKPENGGVSVERAAELIIDGYADELSALGFKGDDTDVRNVIIEVLSYGNPRAYVKNLKAQREAEQIEQMRTQADIWAAELGFKDYDKYIDYEISALERIIQEYKNLDYTEFYNKLAEIYEYDTTRESESTGRGSEILQGEQTVPAGRGEDNKRRNQGRTVSDGLQVLGENGTPQGNQQVNEPVGEAGNQSEDNLEMVAEGENAPGQGDVVDNNTANALQNGNNELNLQKENESDNEQNQNDIPVGGQVSQSVPQGEYREVAPLSGGVQETAARLRERIESAQGDSKSGLREVENRVTREFAQENGIWIENEFKLGVPFPSGDEHNNYIDAENQVVYKVNNRMHTPSILDLLDRIEQHNNYFPNTQYGLVGFTSVSDNGDVMPVFAQDFVLNARMATVDEIDSYMGTLGFTRVGDGRYSNGEVVIKDLKPRNVLVNPYGDVFVVDAEFEQETEISENGGENSILEQIKAAEAEVNTNPTEAQKEAGNYKKGHVQIGTFNVTIEQPKGSVRSGVDADGKKWETEMQNTYGYIRGTEGVDGDHIDVFLSDDIDGWDGHKVFVVDQRNADGSFDEHKVMLGFNDINDAEAAYMSNYEEGWQGLGAITGVSIEEFEKWIASSHRKTKAFAEYKSVKTAEGQSASAERRNLADFKEGDVVRDYYDKKLYRIKKHSKNGVSTIAELDAEGNEVGTTTMNAHNNSRYSLAEASVKAETPTISQESEQVSEQVSNQDNAPYTIAPAQYTTKKGKVLDMHLVKFAGTLTKEQQRAAKELAKAEKGWYDREQGGFMMRSEESAKQLADTILNNDDAVSDAQPVSLADTRKVVKPQQVNVESLIGELNEKGEAKLSDHVEQPTNPSGNRLVTDERYAELRERMRKKLGGQMNIGIDPEILAIGTEMAVYHLEKGARKFTEYAKVMIADLGDAIRPYLKAFYNGARNLPEVESSEIAADMTPYDEVQQFNVATFDKEHSDPFTTAEIVVAEQAHQEEAEQAKQEIINQRNTERRKEDEQTSASTETIANQAEAVASKAESDLETATTEEQLNDVVAAIDNQIEAVNKQLALLGYYEADIDDSQFHESYGYMRSAEKKAVKDADALAKRIVKDLNIDPATIVDKKGKKRKMIAQANIAPAGGDVSIRLPLTSNRELYIDVLLEPDYEGGKRDNLSIDHIYLRIEDPTASGYKQFVGRNVWVHSDATYTDMLDEIRAEIIQHVPEFDLPAKQSVTHTEQKQEKQKKSKKKTVNSQQSGELGLFDSLFDNETNNDNGLQRTDDVRTGRLQTDDSRHKEGLSRGSETGSESEQQDSRGTDLGGERTGDAVDRTVRPRLSDAVTEKKNTRNNHSERGKDHAPTSVDARIEANIKAIELAKQLLESGEQATEKQMQTLRKFSGWGGLGKAFSEGTYYAPNLIAKRLRELLGEAAYQEAVMSANSAYYTPAYVVDTLWDIAEQMGFKGGNILEGSAGIGNILGQMPTHISERSNIQAIEIDGTSGGILSLLYPDAKVEIQGFEETRIANGSVDLAITNVPFVTGLRVNDTTGDKDLSKKFHNIHDFCIAKNVRKLREGGLGIFITSNGTLDNSKKLRDWIVNEGGADFVGAFRMHNKTFGGTGVTSDIIVIRKRVNGKKSANAIDVSTVTGERMAEYDTGETRKVKGQIVPVVKQLSMDYNQYFVEHPENMAGEMHFAFEKGDTFRPTSKGLYPKQDKKQEQMLAEFVQSFTAEEFGEKAADEIEVIDAMPGKKIGEVFVSDGKLYINAIGAAQPLEVNANKVKGHTKVECFEAYSAIKEALAAVLEYQINHEDDKGLKPLLAKLNKAYDDFVATYGHFNKNTAIAFLRNDVDYANVFALEKFEASAAAKGNQVQKFGNTDVFSKRVIEKEAEPMPTNVKDGIVASIFKFGRVDIPYIAEQLGKSEAEVKAEIIESGYGFEDPATRQVEVSYQYLSGNVREKLRQAEENNENGEFDRNIKALQEVMPMTIPAHLIDFTLGSSWIEPKLYEEYVKERTDVGVQFTAVGGTWFMNEPYYTAYEKNRAMGVTSEMLGRTVMGHTLIEAAIQNKSITVSTVKKNWDGSTETITDKEATQACSAKIDEIRQDFKEWARQKMQSDAEMSERMERVYNDTFNNYVPMSIPDEFVPEYFGGASHKFKMRSHQGRAIVRGTMQPLLLAHEVGTGKTFTLISTAMEMRRLGTARKPMIVVQNATVGQFVASAKELYPNAKILTLEEADRSADGRKNFYAKIKYNDWDMIVVPQSTFEFIPDSEERQMAFVQDKIEEKMLILEQMKEADPDGKSMIARQAEREIALLEEELAGLSGEIGKKRTANDEKKRAVALQNAEVKAMEMLDRRTDDVENFDDMGIDALLIDEAHEYKHLGFATAMQRGVKGVDPSYSKKSQGVFLKTQAVLEKNNGRNVIFATGTPISNTAAEIWTFMRYLMPADTMKEYDIYYFDDFVRNFGNIQQMLEFTTSGKFKENNRFAGYVNLPELVRIWSGVSDTVLTKEAGGVSDKIPDMEGGKAQDLYLPQTRALRSIMKYVKAELERYDKMSGKQKKENSHIPLTMYGIAKAAAVDARLVQSDAEDDTQSKTNEAVRQTLRSLKESADYKGTVAIFADNYQNKESGFNLYEDIRTKLIAEGVPADEIVVIKSGMTVKKKLEIFEKVNRGEVRVILGSTFTLGTGVNIQERLYTLIHLDAPNRPMDYTQRNGRILRQGNLHKAMGKPVRVLRFGVEDSLDVTAYQRLKTKGAIADSIMNGKQMMSNSMTNRVLEEEEDVFGDTVAQLSGSEYAMLKNNAEKNVRKYASRKKQWEADQTYIHNAKPRVKALIKEAEKRIEDNSRYLEAVGVSFPDGKFKEIVIGKHRFASIEAMEDFFKEHNKSLLAEMKQMKDGDIAGEQKRQLTIQIGDFSFVVTTKLTRQTVRDGATLFNDVERKMTYSCAELGIEDIPVRQNLLRNAIEDITNNVITGRDFAERVEIAERVKKHNEAELEQLLSREGKPFEYEAELEQAQAQYEEFSELMKKELEEKEAKYAEMDADVEAANDLATAEEAEELQREGEGMLTDRDVVMESDPYSKVLGRPRYYGKRQREYATRQRDRMARKAEQIADLLGIEIDVYDTADELNGKRAKAKGWFNPKTGKIAIVVSNHGSTGDIIETVLHEGVAHYGLRKLFGKHFDTFLDNVYNNVSYDIREKIVELAKGHNWDFRRATEEYLASLAENTNFEKVNPSLWSNIKSFFIKMLTKVGITLNEPLSDNELRYILWRSYQNLVNPGWFNVYGQAEDVSMQYSLSVGNYAEDAADTYIAADSNEDDLLMRVGYSGFMINGELVPDKYVHAINHSANWRKKHKGAARCIVIQSGETLRTRLERAGFTQEKIDIAENMYNDGTLAAYFPVQDMVVIFNTDASESEIIGYLWHENAHRAIDRLYTQEEIETLFKNIVGKFEQDIREGLTEMGYEEDKQAEEFLVRMLEDLYLAHPEFAESGKFKFPEDENVNTKLLADVIKPLINFINNGNREEARRDAIRRLGDRGFRLIYDKTKGGETVEVRNSEAESVRGEAAPKAKRGEPEARIRAEARNRYERRVKSGMFQSREALQDSMLGLKEAMQAILGQGTNIEDVDGFENAYLGENRLSSVNKAEADAFAHLLFKPMLDEVAKLARNEAEREELTDYMMAKHGLERNRIMAERDAIDYVNTEVKKLRKELERKNIKEDEVKEINKKINLLNAKLNGVAKNFSEHDARIWYETRKKSIDKLLNDGEIDEAQYYKRIKRLDTIFNDGFIGVNREKDYAGLTALTGMDNVADAEAEAQRMVDDYEQAHETDDLWEKVNAVSKAILQKSYECGMMSKETFDKVSDMYEFYIPLRGFDEKTSNEAYAYLTHKHSAFNAPIKKAEGRRSKADDPFANLQSMAESAIMQGNRNKLVKQRFLNFALNHPSDLVSVSDIWVEYDAVTDEWKPVFPDNIESTDTPEEVEQKMQDFETKMESLAQQHPDQYKRGKDAIGIPYRIVESRDMRQHQVVVKRGGRDYVITINGNPRAAQALNGQTNPDNDMSGAIGAILRAGEKINRQLSAFYTTRNPDFIVSNFMRDMLYTNSMAWIKESPNYALRFHRNYLMVNPVTMKRLLAKYRKGTLDMSNKTEAMFHQFMMNGGETGYANIRDIEQHKNDIRKELKRANGKLKLARAWSLLAEKFDELNRAVENCARFAAFVTSREMGRSIDRAIYDAKEISVNFNKKGSGAKFYDSVGQTKAGNASALVSGLGRSGYVFWNAAIQGTTNFGRQMKRHPAKAFTGVAAMFLLGAIVAYLGGDDDEDDKNAYYNLPEYVRRSNILFRAGDSWISIPLPIEYRAFYGMGELMTSVFSGKEHLTGGEIAEAVLGQATQILPIDFLEGGGGLNAFVPSTAKPLWEAYVAEKSWTGMPLYKDTPYNKDMPEWTKAYSSTNKHIVNLAATLNEATGGDPYTKGAIDINPAKVEYMLNGYFGGVFGTIDKLTKTAETIVGDREYDPRSILLVNRLVKAGDERTEYRAVNNEYFRLKEEHDRLKTRLRHYEEDTDNGIFDYAEKMDFLYNSPEYERYEIFEDYRKDIDDLYDEMQEAVDDEERKDIEAELNELKKEMIQEMNTTRKRK